MEAASRDTERPAHPSGWQRSISRPPAPVPSPLAPDAFSAERAFGGKTPLRNSLLELGRSFPNREPGSADDSALADRVADTLATRDDTNRPGFKVTRRHDDFLHVVEFGGAGVEHPVR